MISRILLVNDRAFDTRCPHHNGTWNGLQILGALGLNDHFALFDSLDKGVHENLNVLTTEVSFGVIADLLIHHGENVIHGFDQGDFHIGCHKAWKVLLKIFTDEIGQLEAIRCAT